MPARELRSIVGSNGMNSRSSGSNDSKPGSDLSHHWLLLVATGPVKESLLILFSSVFSALCLVDRVRNSHSQMVRTRQPSFLSRRALRMSLATFASNFFFQKSDLVAGNRPAWHRWACQKQPCTKTTAQYFGKTRSGLPGNLGSCSRYLNPLELR